MRNSDRLLDQRWHKDACVAGLLTVSLPSVVILFLVSVSFCLVCACQQAFPRDLVVVSCPESVNSASLLVEQSGHRSLQQNSSVSQICSYNTKQHWLCNSPNRRRESVLLVHTLALFLTFFFFYSDFILFLFLIFYYVCFHLEEKLADGNGCLCQGVSLSREMSCFCRTSRNCTRMAF